MSEPITNTQDVSSGSTVISGGTASSGMPNTPASSADVTSGGTSTSGKDPNFQTTAPTPSNGPVGYNPQTGMTTAYGPIAVYWFDQYGSYTGTAVITRQGGQSAPAFATYIAPPTPAAGQVAVFNTSTLEWGTAEDHRGTVVYNKTNGGSVTWAQPGAIPDGFTTLAPTSQFDKWDADKGAWVVDAAAQKASLQAQARTLMAGDISGNVSFLKMFGQTPGPQYVAYMKAVAAIAWGQDTTSTSLPTAPTDPAQ